MRLVVFVMIPVLVIVAYLRSLKTQATICVDGKGRVTYVSEGDVGAPMWAQGCYTDVITYDELDKYHRLLSR
jgi:hypothetical protein